MKDNNKIRYRTKFSIWGLFVTTLGELVTTIIIAIISIAVGGWSLMGRNITLSA